MGAVTAATIPTTPPAADVAVHVRGVTKDFGSGGTTTRALRGVDLDVPYGELLMLVGPSGCGKTTLVSIIAGTLDPTEGDVVVLGDDLAAMPNGRKVRFRRDNVGFVFQAYNLLPALTAAENAAVPLMCSTNWAWATGSTGSRANFPAASSSGWRSPARSSTRRGC